jgi:hypothetical protein
MSKSFILVLVMGFGTVQAQVKGDLIKTDRLNFLRMQSTHSGSSWIKSTPYLTTISSDQSASTGTFWHGMTYTSYSVNGRFRSTYLFDVQGVLRESRASYSLKKSGMLSHWRVQFSPQRSRPMFTYTIR